MNDKGEWTKISNVGDNIGVDFYHTGLKTDEGKELTLIKDKEGNSAKMFGVRGLLKGGEIRGNDVSWSTITSEYLSGTGPDNSIFEGKHPSNLAIQDQLKYVVAKVDFEESGKPSLFKSINWNLLDVVVTPDMQAQMMGSYGASFYKLGDKTLSFIVDEKSKSSLFYHLPLENTPRDYSRVYNPWAGTWTKGSNALNTTQQIYFFWVK